LTSAPREIADGFSIRITFTGVAATVIGLGTPPSLTR
jgi:hypothetical protein